MSNIETLIATVKDENLKGRKLQIDAWDIQTEILENISKTLQSIQEGLFTFFDEQRDRFLEQQADFDAARRAEAERLKESKAKGFTTPAKTSDGQVAESSGDGLLAGLGFAGLVGALGAAVAGYFAGITAALANGLAAVTKMITPKAFTTPFTDFFRKFKFFARALSDVFKGRQSTFAIKQFGSFSKTLADLGAKLQKAIQPITNGITKLTTIAKNFFSPLGELAKLFPSGGGKFLEGIKAFGSKLGGIFKLFSKIAVPLTVIIGTFKGIVASFDEFGEDTSLLEKILITFKNVVRELFSAFVTSLLELGKDIISWVAGALGFEEVEKFLDSFDIDQKFREIFDGGIKAIVEWFAKAKDALYQAAEAIGLVDTDPEAEARIAQREADEARENLAEADTRVQEARAAVEAAPEGSRERARAESELGLAVTQRNARAQDVQEAEVKLQEAQVFGRTALDESAQDDSLKAAKQSGLYQERPLGFDSKIDTAKLAETTDVNQLKAIINDNDVSPEAKQMVLDRIQELEPTQPNQPAPAAQPSASADQLQEVMVPSRELRSTTASADQLQEVMVPSRELRSTTASADQLQEVAVPSRPRVEPLSDLTNVTSINQATTAMQTAISSIIPSEAGDLNLPGQDGIDGALSPAGIVGAGLGAVIDGVKNLTSLPVAQASQEVAAAKDKPQVVALSGGSNSQVVNNTTNQQTVNMGAMSARSQDISNQRRADLMMA